MYSIHPDIYIECDNSSVSKPVKGERPQCNDCKSNITNLKKRLRWTQGTLLQKQDSSLVSKIDNRLLKISQFQKFQMFTNRLQSIFRMTAKEYRILIKVIVFVVNNLYEENKNNIKDFVENRKLLEVYAK
ncbi:hypothetical protein Glove_102g11 [Diversispora epigaea]|uniref:Uncharacterized protein n=1 Tax=Diversispora epigaea TaxID=1348612 RepID=A0A397J3U4_9GLOM|nr:hypothetical protein Glove_102g11 [Diversispora epigaea]